MYKRQEPDRTKLIDILWDVQRESGYISAEAAAGIADWLGLSVEDVLETATFYHFFHTTPSGRHRIYLSNTVIAKMHGYRQVYEALELDTGTRFGGPGSVDFGLFETACIGLSDHEPATVSYTHLDVYKRQVLRSLLCRTSDTDYPSGGFRPWSSPRCTP